MWTMGLPKTIKAKKFKWFNCKRSWSTDCELSWFTLKQPKSFFSRGQEEKSGTGLMHSDPKTSIFYLGHKELRAAVCVRSGLPLGDLDRWQNSCPETAFLKWGGGGWLGGTGVNMANSIRPRRQGFLLGCTRKKVKAEIHPSSVVWNQYYAGLILWSVVTPGASPSQVWSAKCFLVWCLWYHQNIWPSCCLQSW